ncbi:MAG: hypothetical protein A2007_06475 [Verrucomicrobia bacterium GWC2_42_7]|nr:MAG: hypothetical protein A2007_06475 [Verrucomicrobia bacterium GWC2_42_7]
MKQFLILFGSLLAIGVIWPLLSSLGLGSLPGDLLLQMGNLKLYIHITTSLILSLVLLAIWALLKRE